MKKALSIFVAVVFALSLMLALPLTAEAAAKPKITNISMPEKIDVKTAATISFKVDQKCTASVEIYDSKNKLVVKLAKKSVKKNATVTFKWNGKNAKKKYVPQGKYKVNLIAGKTKVKKYITVADLPGLSEVYITEAFYLGEDYCEVDFRVDKACVTYIAIYDANANMIAVYEDYNAAAGEYVEEFAWDGTDMNDQYVPPGQYIVAIWADGVMMAYDYTTALSY